MAKSKGFYYSYDSARIKAYADLSVKEKLEWLYQANQFCKKAIKGRRQRIWKAFREGAV
jgi:hypothetical protein